MTIQNGLLHEGVAYLWTDTAHWDPDTGKRVLVSGKVYQGTVWPWAVAISGDSHDIATQLGKFMNATPGGLLQDARTALEAEAEQGRLHRLLFAWPDEYGGEAPLCSIMSEAACGIGAYEAVPVRSFLCWGKDADWFEPFRGKALTPADMREIVKLQMDNYDCPLFPNGIEDSRSDIVETRIGAGCIEHVQLRLVGGEWQEVALGDGFRWLTENIEQQAAVAAA